MNIKTFEYLKEGATEKKQYEVLVLPPKAPADATHECGIALSALTEEERLEVIAIQQTYEEAIKPFVTKYFRNFVKTRMTLNG